MQNFKKKNILIYNKIIILKIFFIFLITSCNLNVFQKNHIFLIDENNQKQFKKLTIPKGINIPKEDPEYKIPYTKKDIDKKRIDIFPPI